MTFLSFHDRRRPHDIQLFHPERNNSSENKLNRFIGSMIGLATGDALGASCEFRPHQYFVSRPVEKMEGGGTWGLQAGQWTDDTSMALCLASSLITMKKYDPYNQMVRYKRWYQQGYLSSTGNCFDIGNATRDSLETFISRQNEFVRLYRIDLRQLDGLSYEQIEKYGQFKVNCSGEGVAGNGALMRLAPIPLFFCKHPQLAIEYAGRSARLTHGDRKAIDACRYYAALIVAAIHNIEKDNILKNDFYDNHREWFGKVDLHPEILRIARGSFKNSRGYEGGIRGTGYIVNALEAALWALWKHDDFGQGALAAVNLGDDTDTTAAIYGQLAGAIYGYNAIPLEWTKQIYARDLIVCMSKWLLSLADQYQINKDDQLIISSDKIQQSHNELNQQNYYYSGSIYVPQNNYQNRYQHNIYNPSSYVNYTDTLSVYEQPNRPTMIERRNPNQFEINNNHYSQPYGSAYNSYNRRSQYRNGSSGSYF